MASFPLTPREPAGGSQIPSIQLSMQRWHHPARASLGQLVAPTPRRRCLTKDNFFRKAEKKNPFMEIVPKVGQRAGCWKGLPFPLGAGTARRSTAPVAFVVCSYLSATGTIQPHGNKWECSHGTQGGQVTSNKNG